MSKKDVETINALTKSVMETMGPEKGVAILSSVICQLYAETDQQNAIVLTQPHNGAIVVITTLDAADQITRIVEKTMEQLPDLLKEFEEQENKPEGIKCVDGDARDKTTTPPKRKLH